MIIIIKKIVFLGILALILVFFLPLRIEADTQRPPSEEPLVGLVTASYIPRTEWWRSNARTIYEDGTWPDITRIIEYEGVEALADIPQEVGGQAWNEELEAAGYGRLFLTGLKELSNEDGSTKSRWQAGFSMVVTFRDYGAETYELNGRRISHQEERPPLWESQEALLGLIGGTTADYRITEIEWLGERYTDDFGIPYRNARVTGLRKVSDYQAVYQGKAIAPRILQTTGREQNIVEREEPEEPVQEESEQEETAAETLLQDEMPESEEVSDLIRETAAETISQEGESLPELTEVPPDPAAEGEYIEQPARRISFTSVKTGFIRLSKRIETWIYQKFSIHIPGSLLLGTGMVLGSAITALGIRGIRRRRKKNSL